MNSGNSSKEEEEPQGDPSFDQQQSASLTESNSPTDLSKRTDSSGSIDLNRPTYSNSPADSSNPTNSSSPTDSNHPTDNCHNFNCESNDQSAASPEGSHLENDQIDSSANQNDLHAKDQTNHGEQSNEEKNGKSDGRSDPSSSDHSNAPELSHSDRSPTDRNLTDHNLLDHNFLDHGLSNHNSAPDPVSHTGCPKEECDSNDSGGLNLKTNLNDCLDRANDENESHDQSDLVAEMVAEMVTKTATESTAPNSIQNSETRQIDETDQNESEKPNCKPVSDDEELLKSHQGELATNDLIVPKSENLESNENFETNAEKFRTLNSEKGESDHQKSELSESANSNSRTINSSEVERGNERTNGDTRADSPICERSNERSADSRELSNSENDDIAQLSNSTNIAHSADSTSDTSASTADAALARCEQPIVHRIHRKIDIEIAVDELCKGAESCSLLLKKYTRTNNDPTDEEPTKLDRQASDAQRPASSFDHSHANLNGELIAQSNLAKSSDLSSIGEWEQRSKCASPRCASPKCTSPFDLSSSLQSIGNLNLALALSGRSSRRAEDLLPAKNDHLELARSASSPNGRSKHHSEVIINYCEKIDSSSLINSKHPKSRRTPASAPTEESRPSKPCASGQIGQAKRPEPCTHPLDNSYNSVPFSAFTDPDRIKFVDIVKKVNLPSSSQSQAECIVLDEEDEEDQDDLDEELNDKKFANNEANDPKAAHRQAKPNPDHVDAVISSDEAKQTKPADCNRSVIARKFAENQSEEAADRSEDTNNQNSNQNQPKMSTLISPSNKLDLFDDLEAATSTATGQTGNKMDPPANKPLKGLLKKAKSSDSTGSASGKKKRRVKFAETMMVWWVPSDDWSDELMMPQMIALKSPSEFNLVEIAAQTGYMFEPPAEYKDLDFLPFDPPPDYRDCINSNTNPFAGNDLNFSNLPNHALLQMYENDGNPDLLSKLDFDDDMFMKFNYATGDHSEFCDVLKDGQLEDNEQLDAYKDMILNNSNEMLEEDDIIGVLKEDDILQAIGSQIDSLDKKDGSEPDAESGSTATREENGSEKEHTAGQQNIIILNKNGNCQPIQIITSSESSDISFSNMEDYPMSPNGSLQDLASDSSITSQDTIIMMTNAILTDKTNAQNHFLSQHHNVDLQTKRNRLRLSEPQNAAKEESSSSKDSGIITTDSDNQDSLRDSTKDEEMAPGGSREKNDENNNQDNEMKSKAIGANGVPQLVQNFQKYSTSLTKQDAQLNSVTKIEKSAAVSVSELRESFERRMSVNSDKSDSSSSSIGNNQPAKDKVDANNPIYQNIPLNGSFADSESSGIVEYSSEPKVVMLPNKRTTSLQSQQQQGSYSPQSGKGQKASASQTDAQLNQQNAPHLHVQANLQQQATSPQLQSKLITSNENKQLLITSQQAAAVLSQQTAINQHNLNLQQALNQQLTQQLVQQQQQQQQQQTANNQAAAVQQAKLNQLNMMRSIPVQRMPNGNIYLSIDRRTLPHQIKMIPTQISQIRPPPYELSKTNANNQLQQQTAAASSTLKQPAQAAIVPIPHIHLVTSAKIAADQQQAAQQQAAQQQVGQQPANSQPSAGTAQSQQQPAAGNQSANKPATGQQPNENKPQQFHYQTLPIRFTANAKQIRLQPNLTAVDAKCCPNQTTGIATAAANAQPQPGKPQLILIHSYPPNNLAGGQQATLGQLANIGQLGNQKAIAIKMIHHPADKTGANQTLAETPALLTANGKIITTVAPNGTILNPNLMNSNAIIQQALLRGTLKDPSTSSFPNASEIRRRDGLNAFPYVWNPNDAKPGTAGHPSAEQLNKAAKDELESFVRQDMQRTERIRKRYSVAEEENDEDPSFGFARRPSIKSIKSKFGGSTEMIKQLQPQLSAPNQKPLGNNIIQLTTKASAVNAANMQAPNSQIILASQQLKGPVDLAKLTAGQPVKAIPIIQKTQNNQRHVYLIQNQLAQNAQLAGNFQQQQRLIHAGATLPRNTSGQLSAVNSPASTGATAAGANLSNPAQTNPNNSRTVNNANPGQRPSSSLDDHKDNQPQQQAPQQQQLTKANLNMNSINGLNLGDPSKPKQQIMYYHNVVNCNKIALAPNAANLSGQVQQQQQTGGGLADAGNPLQYKTISMPNVALIKTALISQQQQQNQSQILAAGNPSHPNVEQLVKSGSQLITLVAANGKDQAVLAQNANNAANSTLVQKSSTITKQTSSSSTSSINSSMSSSSLSTTAASSSSSASASCNNQTPNNQTNNSNLVKEAATKEAEKVAKLKQANKDEMIFYQMSV